MSQVRKIALTVLCLIRLALIGQGNWTQKAQLGPFMVSSFVGFSVNGKGYVVGRSDCEVLTNSLTLEYDPATDAWAVVSNFPGALGSGATGFSIGNFGYLLTGYLSGPNPWSKQLWEFDPAKKSWTRKADIPGAGRSDAFSFSIGQKGYVGGGRTIDFNRLKDLWEWDQATDTWTQKADLIGWNRSHAVGFSAGGKGYAGLGRTDSFPCSNDFYRYDPVSNTWSSIAKYPGGCTLEQSSFVICDRGYIGPGPVFNGVYAFFEYDPSSNSWAQMDSIGGPRRTKAFAFAIGGKGYMGTGNDAPLGCLNDHWEFSPTVDNCNLSGLNDFKADKEIEIYPSPANETLFFKNHSGNAFDVQLFNYHGNLVRSIKVNESNVQVSLNISDLCDGFYFTRFSNTGGHIMHAKILVRH